ncbi:MAG: hypothetical protein GEV07_06360 [Streptosporangiales bacterium]|nr:hypothetical protein [Streptosporangiales bacterium]
MVGTILATVVLAAACGGSGNGSDGGGKLRITSPSDGASVGQPFTLKFDAGDIGPPDSGKNHVHVFIDGEEDDYTVVTKGSFVVKGLSNGDHTITVTKQRADHSPTGAEAEIDVNVTGGDKRDDDTDDDGGGYGY